MVDVQKCAERIRMTYKNVLLDEHIVDRIQQRVNISAWKQSAQRTVIKLTDGHRTNAQITKEVTTTTLCYEDILCEYIMEKRTRERTVKDLNGLMQFFTARGREEPL